jgi:threonylcarbamoyladenosine tRNA methylthiotransferase MtaB
VGCLVQNWEEAEDDKAIDLLVGNNKKGELVALLREYEATRETKQYLADFSSGYEEMQLRKPFERTRAYVKIQDGCDQFCSYCIVPYVRGRSRSRSAEAIVAESTELVNNGCKELVLTGINLSAYGADFGETGALLALLARLSTIPDLERIRLGSLEPHLITPAFAKGVLYLPKVCRHFHISLQSGSTTVLERMNRHYSPREYLEKVALLREIYGSVAGVDFLPAISTDIIVGFPGETEEEFAETMAFLRKVGFQSLHIFPYSARQGTAAAKLPGQVAADVIKERCQRLVPLADEMCEAYRRHFVGNRVSVIIEGSAILNGHECWVGRTNEYLRAAIPVEELRSPAKVGDLVKGTFL